LGTLFGHKIPSIIHFNKILPPIHFPSIIKNCLGKISGKSEETAQQQNFGISTQEMVQRLQSEWQVNMRPQRHINKCLSLSLGK
jgi:hypothetical protein